MNSIDLSFLSVNEVETILNVIEIDFELKATEKSRLSRLRKTLNKKDQQASEVNKKSPDVSFCVICSRKFIFIFNPKRICCSCCLQICRYCSRFSRRFSNYICQICQKQKDLIAMNCSWFYKNMEKKFAEEGSQIVAYSLIEYLRNNSSSPEIMNMVKGAQISKFRLEMDEATRTIEESLIKVELSSTDDEVKSAKYTELIQVFVEKLKQIIRNTSRNLYLTMENYLYKIGDLNSNIDVEVMNSLQEEVELRVGVKIDISPCLRKILKRKGTTDDQGGQDNLETILSEPILDKVLCDVQQSLVDTSGKTYEDLNSTLKSMIKKSKSDHMDFDMNSVSQVPSRRNTIRHSIKKFSAKSTIVSDQELDSTKSEEVYVLNNNREKSLKAFKQRNDLLTNNHQKTIDTQSLDRELMNSPSISVHLEDNTPTDSDALSMPEARTLQGSNWIMKARYPLGSLNSLFNEADGGMLPRNAIETTSMRSVISLSNNDGDDRESILSDPDDSNYIERMFLDNRSILSDSNNTDIAGEYRRNNDIAFSKNGSQPSGNHETRRNLSNRSNLLKAFPKGTSNNHQRQASARSSVISLRTESNAHMKHLSRQSTIGSSMKEIPRDRIEHISLDSEMKEDKMELSRQSSWKSTTNTVIPVKLEEQNREIKPNLTNLSRQSTLRSSTKETQNERTIINPDHTSLDLERKQMMSNSPNRTDSQRSNNKDKPMKFQVARQPVPFVASNNAPIKVELPRQSSLRSSTNRTPPVNLEVQTRESKPNMSDLPVRSDSLRSDNRNISNVVKRKVEPNSEASLTPERTKPLVQFPKTSHSPRDVADSRNKKALSTTKSRTEDNIASIENINSNTDQIEIPKRKNHVLFLDPGKPIPESDLITSNALNVTTDRNIVLRSKPQVPVRKNRLSSTLSMAPPVPKRKSQIGNMSTMKSLEMDSEKG